MLHRLMLRGLSVEQCADAMGLSGRTVIRMRGELAARMRAAGKFSDPLLLRGKTDEFFDRLIEEALGPTLGAHIPFRERLDALKTALAIEESRQRFLSAAGVYRAYPTEIDPAAVRSMNPDAQRQVNEGMGRLSHFLDLIVRGSPELDAEIAADIECGKAMSSKDMLEAEGERSSTQDG
ncbi:hypothetical protein GXW71_21525 [Roseomonas hellenica]|uniref:Uncharacterized protein n=1 Tax=Plastoroseomonas hellenica TaxID=2687306 RepID=A0ABS5F339_9PROT|nr:hypothetical protein [Plastoroseomonas hellenica]MBR0666955.1 hypothetical protein [Plastoroseomonas hellenica]